MGGPAALFLSRAGVRLVAIADVEGTVANPSGLDIETLYRARSAMGVIDRSACGAGDVV
jgi:glutamate dehydrogenase (NAD(P)+)